MAVITISTPFNIELEFSIAPFGKRMLAWVIDMLVICVYYYGSLKFIYPLFGIDNVIGIGSELFIVILPVLIYQLLFELLFNGQTIGKMAAGIKVIDIDGQEPTWGQYAMRWMLCLGNLSIYMLPYVILKSPWLMIFFMILYVPDFLSVMISAKSQRIADLAAGTVVIDKHYRPSITETIYIPVTDRKYTPVYPEVMRLADRDINGIRNLLDTKRPSKETDRYMDDVAKKITVLLGIRSDLSSKDFLQQLLTDYNYYSGRIN